LHRSRNGISIVSAYFYVKFEQLPDEFQNKAKKGVKIPEKDQWNIENSGKIHGRVRISFTRSTFTKVNDRNEAILLSLVCIGFKVN